MKVIAEVLYAYLWWSIFQALPGILWFYPLCLMHISGFEVLGGLWLSPVLMKFACVRKFVLSPGGLLVVRILALIGVGSYLASDSLFHLIWMAVGNSFAMLALVGMLWDKSDNDRYRHGYLHMLGYLLYLAVRIWGSSFNYIFMNTHLNIVGVCVGVVSSVVLYINDVRSPVASSNTSKQNQSAPPPSPGLLATSLAFASLLFLTSLLFSEVSIITRWAVASHPNPGPQPYPWGMATLLALSLGLILFGHYHVLVTSVQWFSVGVVSAMVFYLGQTYTAFFGGLVLAVYTASLWPILLKRVVQFPPHTLFAITVPVYFGYVILSVWVVAYNFVPGGVYTRERTDVMLMLLITCCGLGTCDLFSGRGKSASTRKVDSEESDETVNFIGHVFRRLSTVWESPEEEGVGQSHNQRSGRKVKTVGPTHQSSNSQEPANQSSINLTRFHHVFMKGTALILIFALLGYVWRYQPERPPLIKERPRVFSAGIWAFHFGYDNQGWPSMERAAQFIENSEVDVIGLLETDAARPYIGSHDIASWLGERLHMYTDYGPGTNEHTWGVLILSKYPIVQSQHHMLPSPEGEIAPAILATVNISGHLVDFYVVHFGNDVDDLDRMLQAENSAHIVENASHPVVMLSYITCKRGSRDYNTITQVLKDVDPSDNKRFCEYVFYRNLSRIAYARISHGGLSDTELQIGKFQIPDTTDPQDWDVMTTDPSGVPSWVHFPSRFGNHFSSHFWDESQHHFHMNTPKYFKLN